MIPERNGSHEVGTVCGWATTRAVRIPGPVVLASTNDVGAYGPAVRVESCFEF